jgi:hypothetical protein
MTKQERFNEIWSGLHAKMDFDRYPEFVFLFKNKELYFEIFLHQYFQIACSRKNVFDVFLEEFNMTWEETQRFITKQVCERLDLNIFNIRDIDAFIFMEKSIIEHFKNRKLNEKIS